MERGRKTEHPGGHRLQKSEPPHDGVKEAVITGDTAVTMSKAAEMLGEKKQELAASLPDTAPDLSETDIRPETDLIVPKEIAARDETPVKLSKTGETPTRERVQPIALIPTEPIAVGVEQGRITPTNYSPPAIEKEDDILKREGPEIEHMARDNHTEEIDISKVVDEKMESLENALSKE